MTEETNVATVNLVMLRGEVKNQFGSMLSIPGSRYQKRMEITTAKTEDELHKFVRRWQLAAIQNHCNFVVDFMYIEPSTFPTQK